MLWLKRFHRNSQDFLGCYRDECVNPFTPGEYIYMFWHIWKYLVYKAMFCKTLYPKLLFLQYRKIPFQILFNYSFYWCITFEFVRAWAHSWCKWVNPLILTAAKSILTLLMKSFRQRQTLANIWRRNVNKNTSNNSPSNIS